MTKRKERFIKDFEKLLRDFRTWDENKKMNKPKTLRQEIEEELRELVDNDNDSISFFPYGGDSHDFSNENCLSFLFAKLIEVVERVEEEMIKGLPAFPPKDKRGNTWLKELKLFSVKDLEGIKAKIIKELKEK